VLTERQVLTNLSFGKWVAEYETESLRQYFVATDQWRQVIGGNVDVILGPKGSGKSAIYRGILDCRQVLEKDGICVIEVKNPMESPSFLRFQPANETEFRNAWKMHFLCILAQSLQGAGIRNRHAGAVVSALEELRLLPAKGWRNGLLILKDLRRLAGRAARLKDVEWGVKFSEASGLFEGFTTKVTPEELSDGSRAALVSADDLLRTAAKAYSEDGYRVWLLLDRLDSAFSGADVEKAALRGIFRCYIDMLEMESIRLKIFLRSDIWKHMADEAAPLREATHVTREIRLSWTPNDLLNLVISRGLNNTELVEWYVVNADQVKADLSMQLALFYDIFGGNVENQPTFDWIMQHIKDGHGAAMPREIIHLLNAARDRQIRMHEIGSAKLAHRQLVQSDAIMQALAVIAEDTYEKGLCQEFPELRRPMECFRQTSPFHTCAEIARRWRTDIDTASETASRLVEIGFFRVDYTADPPTYEIPQLYCVALGIKQGE
jgi:hypothetical protein